MSASPEFIAFVRDLFIPRITSYNVCYTKLLRRPMDSNTIRAHVSLSFKGEAHELDALIDLDLCVTEPGVTPDVHRLLAEQAGIDPYSSYNFV